MSRERTRGQGMERKTMLRTTRLLLVMFLIGICGRGYGLYSQVLKAKPDAWMDIVNGTASAPEQYRVGVVLAAYWLSQHVAWHGHRLGLGVAFWVFDVVSGCLAALLLYQLLVRAEQFEKSTAAAQWFGSAAFAALMFYLVDWLIWYQRVSTLPIAAIVAVMLWLLTSGKQIQSSARQAATVVAFFVMALVQSFIRADVALMVCTGVFVASAARISPRLSMARGVAMATAASAGITALAVQAWLVKVRYPHASYGNVHIVMLIHERRVVNLVTALIFLAPFLWTLREAVRQRWAGEGAGGALLIASVGYACLWLVMGRMDEVRIFLPMAMAVTPLTIELAMRKLNELIDRPGGRVAGTEGSLRR